jgi:hypothetical protein
MVRVVEKNRWAVRESITGRCSNNIMADGGDLSGRWWWWEIAA